MLSKDVSDSGNVLVSKSSGEVMATGKAVLQVPLSEMYLADPAQFQKFSNLIVDNPKGGIDIFAVNSISFVPNVSATVNTTSGRSFFVDSAGIHDDSAVASACGLRQLLVRKMGAQITADL